MEATMNQITVTTALSQLKKQYGLNLPGKISKAVDTVRALLAVPRDRVLLEIAHRGLHSLAGSSATYGYDALSLVAREAERLLQDSLETGTPLTPPGERQLREQMLNLGVLAALASCEAQAS
jgi:HPt (histidine-containing phosphotransfer) domain-containing protein